MYFCSDIHGSERCWKKFLATPKHYECDTIVIGGDITGKFIVPVIEYKRGRYKARFAGIERKVSAGPHSPIRSIDRAGISANWRKSSSSSYGLRLLWSRNTRQLVAISIQVITGG